MDCEEYEMCVGRFMAPYACMSLASLALISAFVNPSILPNPIDVPMGLLAGDFDGQPPQDMWVWAESGARLYLGGNVSSVEILIDLVDSTTAFEYTSPYASLLFGIAHDFGGLLVSSDLSGNLLDEQYTVADTVVAVSSPGQGRFVTAAYHSKNWSHLRFVDPTTLDEAASFLRGGLPSLRAGDFDGDQQQEVLASSSELELILDVFTEPCILPLDLAIEPEPILPAVGDHDGDGDDEFAVIAVDGTVIVVDVE